MRGIAFLYLLFIPFLSIAQAKKARSQIEKGKMEDAHELLKKALSKDSLAASEKYVLASLFFNSEFSNNNLDSAYHYVIQAIEAYGKTATKEQLKSSAQGFDSTTYHELKKKVETAGYSRAKLQGGEQDYIDYILAFSSSHLMDSAVLLRDEQAFTTAKKEDTYEVYEEFFITYPNALEVDEAKKRYEKLLFEHMTASKKLNSYQSILTPSGLSW